MAERLSEVECVRAAALEVYRPEGASIWLRSPNPMLGGRIPNELVAEGHANDVLAVLKALAEGVFA